MQYFHGNKLEISHQITIRSAMEILGGGCGRPATLFIRAQKSIHGFLCERNTRQKPRVSSNNRLRRLLAAIDTNAWILRYTLQSRREGERIRARPPAPPYAPAGVARCATSALTAYGGCGLAPRRPPCTSPSSATPRTTAPAMRDCGA